MRKKIANLILTAGVILVGLLIFSAYYKGGKSAEYEGFVVYASFGIGLFSVALFFLIKEE